MMTRKRRLSFASVLALATAVLLLTTAVVCVADVRNAYADDAAASVSVWDGTSSDTSWYDSSKTEFYITNASQLAGFVAGVNSTIDYPDKFEGKTVYISTDIDIDNQEWAGITGEFRGTLDGQGHTISNLKQNIMRGGFFNGNFKGIARNITFKNANITASDAAGVFAYEISSPTSVIENIIIDSCTVSAAKNAGGIVEWTNCTIKNCLVKNSTITSTGGHVGGIVGEGQQYTDYWTQVVGPGLIYNCGSIDNTITTADGSYAGKIVGNGIEEGTTESCYIDGGVAVGNNDGTYIEKYTRTDIASINGGFDMNVISFETNAKEYMTTESPKSFSIEFIFAPSALSVKENGQAIEFNLSDKTLSFETSSGQNTYLLEYTIADVQYTTSIIAGAPNAPEIVKTIDGVELNDSASFLIDKDGVSYVCDTDSADGNQFAIGFASALVEGAKAIVKYGENSVTITGSEKANLGKIATGTYVVEYYYYDGLVSTVSYSFECLKSVGVDHLYYRESAENPWVLSDNVNGIKGMHSAENLKGIAYASSSVDIIAINTNHVSFNVASSSEGEWDCVKIYLNATEYKKKHGDEQTDVSSLSWEKVVFDLEKSDFNVITLTYAKDGAGDSGNDMGYVNNFCSRLVDVPAQAEYIITIDGKDSRKTIENGGTISVGYGKNTTLSLTAPILDGATCDLYLNGVKSDVTLETERGVYYFYVDDATKYAEVQFVYDMEGYDPAPFTYNIDFVPSGSMQENLVIGGNVTIDSSDYMQPCEVENQWESLPCYPFGFNSKLSASKGWLVYSSTNQGIDSSISGIKLVINETGLLTFDYYISSDDSTAPNDAVYFRRDKAITNGYILGDSLCFPLGAFYTKTSDEGYSNAGSRGEVGWQKFELAVQQGQVWHIAYYKGGSVSAGDDTFAIANVLLNSGVKAVNYSADDANGGSVIAKKADGTSVASGESVVMGSEITLSATANDGYKVYGWQNVATGEFTASSSVKVTVVDNTEYKAIIKPIGTYTALVGNTLYATINEAQTANPEGTIYVIEDCTLTDFTLLQGVTLILTYSQSDRTGYAQGGGNTRVSWNCGVDPYVTLTVNGKLTINGKLIVGGVQHKADQSAQGHTSGAYAQMIVGGSVEIANGGYLDVIGRVSGSGTITAKDGATLRQPFTVNNYAGGTNTYALYDANQFPFVQFATINVECKQVVNYGAKVIGSTSLYFWSSITTQDVVLVDKVENRTSEGEGALIWMQADSRLEISYNSEKKIDSKVGNIHLGDFGVTTIDVYGNITAGEFSLQGYGSGTMVLAIPYTYNFNIKSGATVTIDQAYKIMPGAIVTIDNGATVNITENGTLYVYDGLIQADKSGKAYPSADILGNYGFAKSGMLVVNGTLNIDGTFAGIAQTQSNGEINVGANANVANQTIVDGCIGGYKDEESSNETKFEMSGRVYGVNGFVSLEQGKTYRTFANNAFTLKTFTVKSASRMDNLSVELNQAMQGRFAEWNGEKFVLTLTFYVGAKEEYVAVTINGVKKQTDANGTFTCEVLVDANGLLEYFTTNVYTAAKSQTLVLDQEMQTLTHVASGVALNKDNVYTRVYDKDGKITQNFSLFATVSFYGTTDTESVVLSFNSELNGVFVTENVELKDATGSIVFNHNLAVVGQDVSKFVDDVTNLKNAENISAKAIELFGTYNTLIAQNKTVDSNFIRDYFDNVVKLDDFAGKVVKEIAITGSATYGNGEVNAQITYINGTTATATATLSDWRMDASRIVATATLVCDYQGAKYNVTNTCDGSKKEVALNAFTADSAVYDGNMHTVTATLSGLANFDNDTLVYATATFGNNAGEYNVTLELAGEKAVFYTLTGNKTHTCTVSAKDITVTVKDAQAIVGKTETVVLVANASGNVDEIVFTFAIYKGETLVATVGKDGKVTLADGQTLAVGEYTVKAVTDNANYNIASQTEGTLKVVEANDYYDVDFNLGGTSKVYDGNVLALNPTVTVKATGELVDASKYTVSVTGKGTQILEAGTYQITVTLDGETIAQESFNVTEKDVTVTIKPQSSVYGEDINVDQTAYTASGVVGNNDLKVTLTIDNSARNAGKYDIVGAWNNHNYKVTFVGGEKAYEITAKAIVVEIENKESFYGAQDAVLSAKLNGSLAYTDSFDSLGIKLVREAGKNAGTYEITLDSWTNENYTITAENATYTVKKLALRAIVANATSVYGDPLAKLTFTIEGKFAEGESVDVLNAKLSIGNAKNAGTYGIEFAYDNANYDVRATDATYTITKREVTLLVQDATSVYGDADTALVVGITKGTMAYGENENTLVSIMRAEGRNVGTYAITATKADNANYDVTIAYTSATNSVYTITKRPVTVTVKNAELPYTATWANLNAALEYESNGLAGDELNVRLFVLVGGVELTADNFGSMFAGGTHVISASIDNGNYELNVVNGALTVGLPVVSLTDAARGITRVYGNTQNVFNWRTMLAGYLASATDNTFRAAFYSASDLTTPVDIATAGAGAYKMQIEIVHTTAYTFADGSNKSELVDVTVEKADLTDAIVITLGGLTDGGYLVFSYGLSIDASVTGHDDIEIVKVLVKDGAAADEIDAVGAYVYTATIQDANYQGAKTLEFKVVNSAKEKIEGLKKYAGVEFFTRAQYAEAKALLESITEDDTLQINDEAEAKANYANAEALCANYAKVAANLDEIKVMLDAYAAGEDKKLIEAHDYIVALDEEKLALVKQSEEGKAYQEAWQAARAAGSEATEIANKVRDNVLFGVVAAVSALLAMAYVAFGKFRV